MSTATPNLRKAPSPLCFAYDARAGRVRVPNEEVRAELRRAVEGSSHVEIARTVCESIRLVDDALALDEEAVAAVDGWARIEELPSGRGFADSAYLPKRGSSLPALLVELKWNRPVNAAIDRM